MNSLRIHTGGDQMAPDCVRQVDSGTLRGLAELNCDFRTHLKAARPDSRAYGRMQIFGPCVPASGHGFHGDPGDGAPPSRMHGAGCTMACVYQ
jgi:hypothetical protein